MLQGKGKMKFSDDNYRSDSRAYRKMCKPANFPRIHSLTITKITFTFSDENRGSNFETWQSDFISTKNISINYRRTAKNFIIKKKYLISGIGRT